MVFIDIFKEMFQIFSKKEPKDGGYNREWTRSMIHSNVKSYLDEEKAQFEKMDDEDDYDDEMEDDDEDEDIENFDFTKLSTDRRTEDEDE